MGQLIQLINLCLANMEQRDESRKKMMGNPYSCLLEDIVVQGETDTTHGRRPDFLSIFGCCSVWFPLFSLNTIPLKHE